MTNTRYWHVPRRGFSILEVAILIAIAAMLLALILPALAAARTAARRDACATNQRAIGVAWQECLRDTGGFPTADEGAGPWTYAGVTFSPTSGRPSLEFARPLNRHLAQRWKRADGSTIFESPVDTGIAAGDAGSGVTSAYLSFGTSYRANDLLFPAGEPLHRSQITADPSRFVLMGAPFWYETLHETGRRAEWYGAPDRGIVLFLDNSTRTIRVEPGNPRTAEYTFIPGRPQVNPDPAQEGRLRE